MSAGFNHRVDGARLIAALAALAQIGATPDGGCRRLALTDEDKAGRDWLAARTAQVLRSEVTLGDLEWDGSEVYTKRFEALGRKEAGFAELALDGVRARAGGIADKAFRVPEVAVNRQQPIGTLETLHREPRAAFAQFEVTGFELDLGCFAPFAGGRGGDAWLLEGQVTA